jgi:hypothetical protein
MLCTAVNDPPSNVVMGVDGVEKVGFRLALCCLGNFDPAETSRLLVLSRFIGGVFDADATDATVRDLRQRMRAAAPEVAQAFGAPRF